MRFLKWFGIFLLVLIIVYFVGPQPSTPKYKNDLPAIPSETAELEKYIADNEAKHKLKPDNEARIVWFNDSTKEKTEYAVVYLHGFSASQEEGDPVHREFARKFGCNLYLARLADHGIDTTNPLANYMAEKSWRSAVEAYAIGKQLGNKIILLSTSTGCTLALKLCGEFPDILANIMMSPNIAINDKNAWLLNNHWGLQIAQLIVGKHRTVEDTTALYARYWNNRYSTRSLVQLQELLESTMKESTFRNVTQPSLLLYYFKDKDHQDKVVKVSAMKRMFLQLGTPDSLKREVALTNAGNHVLASPIKSKDVESVKKEIDKFAIEILKMQSLNISQIQFHCRDAMSPCANFEMKINSDGTAYYNPEFCNKGQFKAVIKKAQYDSLFSLIANSGFFLLKNNYSGDIIDGAKYVLTVKLTNGKVKTIKDYGPCGPEEIQRVYENIFSLRESQDWK